MEKMIVTWIEEEGENQKGYEWKLEKAACISNYITVHNNWNWYCK